MKRLGGLIVIAWVAMAAKAEVGGVGAPPTFLPNLLQKGAAWTWAYSERAGETEPWASPYLYETYHVVDRVGDWVTVEMSSSDSLDKQKPPHHKFIVNVSECLAAGKKLIFFKRFRIQFYSKSFDGQWRLLSKKHKALAFTEKFNCFSGRFPYNVKGAQGNQEPLFQWQNFASNSWYSFTTGDLQGVMLERHSHNIKVTFESLEYLPSKVD